MLQVQDTLLRLEKVRSKCEIDVKQGLTAEFIKNLIQRRKDLKKKKKEEAEALKRARDFQQLEVTVIESREAAEPVHLERGKEKESSSPPVVVAQVKSPELVKALAELEETEARLRRKYCS
jgi:hypothetical protein